MFFQKQLEHRLCCVAKHAYEHPVQVLVALMLGLTFLFCQLPSLQTDMSSEAFLDESDPSTTILDEFHQTFGRDEVAILGIQSKQVLSSEFLEQLQRLHHDLETQVPYLDEVQSLINVKLIQGDANQIKLEKLLHPWPQLPQDFAAIEQKLKEYPELEPLISENLQFTTIVVRPKLVVSEVDEDLAILEFEEVSSDEAGSHGTEMQEFVEAVRRISEPYQSSNFQISYAGLPVLNHALQTTVEADVTLALSLSLTLMIVGLWVLFQSWVVPFISVLLIALAIPSTFGWMALTGAPITILAQILPLLLLAIGICNVVHLLNLFFQNLAKGSPKAEAFEYSTHHALMAIFMSNVTTAIGLLSFAFVQMPPVADLGIFAAIGIGMVFLLTLLLIPALLALLPIHVTSAQYTSSLKAHWNHHWFQKHPLATILSFSLVSVGALIFLKDLGFSHNELKWFKEEAQIRHDFQTVDTQLKGTALLEIVLDTQKPEGAISPDVFEQVWKIHDSQETWSSSGLAIGHTQSIVSTIRNIHQKLFPEASGERFPADAQTLAQEVLLLENDAQGRLLQWMSPDFSKIRVSLRLPWSDVNVYQEFIQNLKTRLQSTIDPEIEIAITGIVSLGSQIIQSIMHTLSQSYLIAGIGITLCMILVLGSLPLGLFSMLPNFLPIALGLGVMGFLEMPLDLSSILIGSIALGLVVDDTIHMMQSFQRNSQSHDTSTAIQKTLETTGKSIIMTTGILGITFLSFTTSSLHNFVYFGLIITLIIGFALLCDLILLPAMLQVFFSHPSRKASL